MKLSTKLIGGFSAVAAITCLVGLIGWINMSRLSRDINDVAVKTLPLEQGIAQLAEKNESFRVAMRTLMNPMLSQEDKNNQYKNAEKYRKEIEDAIQALTAIPELPNEAKDLIAQIQAKEKEYLGVGDRFVGLSKEVDKTGILNPHAFRGDMERFTKLHYAAMTKVFNLINFKEEFEGGDDAAQCEFGKWLASFKTDNEELQKALDAIKPSHEAFHRAIKKIKEAMKAGDTATATMAYRLELKPSADKTFEHFAILTELAEKSQKLYEEMVTLGMVDLRKKQLELFDLIGKLQEFERARVSKDLEDSRHNVKISRILTVSSVGAGVLLALAIGIFISVTVSRTIRRIASGLYEGSDQLVSAASQVSSSSQTLAETTSQQAAAIEETSSALEEMASMTRQNADNAAEANRLMGETKSIVSEANTSMEELAESMKEINRASEETFKIIKTIDEIAFQTNLLALNAAVEAARAGEAGAGFAVVADEVRSLAMRAAEAAKNTAALIEATVNKVKSGTAITERTREIFLRVAQSAEKVSELLGEIAVASDEQKDGIEQVNRAVSEMDKAVQNNAANAEETASAAEELNAQANELRGYVRELLAIVGGTTDAYYAAGAESGETLRAKRPSEVRALPAPSTRTAGAMKLTTGAAKVLPVPGKATSRTAPNKSSKTVKPIMVWSREYEVGVPEIDEQHQNLFKMLNRLNEAMAMGEGKNMLNQILFGLVDYTARHFKTEEMYMERANYPELESHRQVHIRLTDKVHEMVDRYKAGEVGLGVELLNFLQDWLKKHILGTDKKYAPYLAGLDLKSEIF